MTDTNTAPEYIVEYADGPLEGQTERRILIGGKPEDRVPAIVLVEGLESTFWYTLTASHEVDGEWRATYAFDAPDSDEVAPDPDEESIEL